MMVEVGVRWQEANKADRIVIKEKFFDTEDKMMKFLKKLEKKDNFIRVIAFTR